MTDFEEYIRQGEPDKKEKSIIWQTAIGLQQVDGLKPSAYLIETAKQHIEGKITISEVQNRIDTYYKDLKSRKLHINFVKDENTPNKFNVNNTERLDVNKNTPNILGKENRKKLGVKFNKNQLKILELIELNNKITIIEMAKKLSISETAIENNIKKLREKGIIARVGSDKTGHWEVSIAKC